MAALPLVEAASDQAPDDPVRVCVVALHAVGLQQRLRLPRDPVRHLLRPHDPLLHPLHAVLRQGIQE